MLHMQRFLSKNPWKNLRHAEIWTPIMCVSESGRESCCVRWNGWEDNNKVTCHLTSYSSSKVYESFCRWKSLSAMCWKNEGEKGSSFIYVRKDIRNSLVPSKLSSVCVCVNIYVFLNTSTYAYNICICVIHSTDNHCIYLNLVLQWLQNLITINFL